MTTRLPLQVAFLTGQSDPRRWALSPEQAQFLNALELPAEAIVDLNFPYLPNSPPHRHTLLPLASLNNMRSYLRSRDATVIAKHRLGVQSLIERAERTVFLAGSCGLELFNNLELPEEELTWTEVFAFGPFARRRPKCRSELVQGRRDLVSRWCFREVDHLIECGHMDYLTHPETLRLCRAFIGAP